VGVGNNVHIFGHHGKSRSNSSLLTAITVPVSASENPSVSIDQSILASWSVDAVRLVRHQLHRAGGGVMPKLAFGENWGEGGET
jgi:hypothetical protein